MLIYLNRPIKTLIKMFSNLNKDTLPHYSHDVSAICNEKFNIVNKNISLIEIYYSLNINQMSYYAIVSKGI